MTHLNYGFLFEQGNGWRDSLAMASIRKWSLAVSYGNEPPVANIGQFLSKKNYMNLTHANADINSEYVFAFQLKFCEQNPP